MMVREKTLTNIHYSCILCLCVCFDLYLCITWTGMGSRRDGQCQTADNRNTYT